MERLTNSKGFSKQMKPLNSIVEVNKMLLAGGALEAFPVCFGIG